MPLWISILNGRSVPRPPDRPLGWPGPRTMSRNRSRFWRVIKRRLQFRFRPGTLVGQPLMTPPDRCRVLPGYPAPPRASVSPDPSRAAWPGRVPEDGRAVAGLGASLRLRGDMGRGGCSPGEGSDQLLAAADAHLAEDHLEVVADGVHGDEQR